MRTSKFTNEQIVQALRQTEGDAPVERFQRAGLLISDNGVSFIIPDR